MLWQQQKIWQILISDDCELTRLSLQLLLSKQSHLKVVGCVGNGREAVASVSQYSPNLVILDWQMPVMNGCIAAREIKKIAPDTKIIIYTELNDVRSDYADSICTKSLPNDRFLQEIDRVLLNNLVVRR
jgi:DNA-binding NarL/FixJ family response regulator